MGQTQTTSSKAESYTWGIEIECFLPQSKVQELGISIGSYHCGHPLPAPFPQGWTAERDGSLHTDRGGYVAVEIVSPILQGRAGIGPRGSSDQRSDARERAAGLGDPAGRPYEGTTTDSAPGATSISSGVIPSGSPSNCTHTGGSQSKRKRRARRRRTCGWSAWRSWSTATT